MEAVETLVRDGMHRVGATVLSRLLSQGPPEERTIPCGCGQTAHYKELRRKPITTVVGPVRFERPYYVCSHCSHAPNPVDAALGVENP